MPESLIEELKRYVGFTETDAAVLKGLSQAVEPHLNDLAERFYAGILAHPEAGQVFTGGEAQVNRLKRSLAQWARELFSGTYDDAYAQRRLRIGFRHVEVALPQRYVLGALRTVEAFLSGVIRSSIDDSVRREQAHTSLGRIVTIDTCLLCESFTEASLQASKTLNDRLQQANEGLDRARRDQVAFLATVSHELRAPLTSLLGFAMLLADGHVSSEDDRRTIGGEIRRASHYVLDLLADFIDVSRIDDGLLVLSSEPVNVASLASDVIALCRDHAEAKGLSITHDVDDTMVAAADPKRLRQVLLNLLGNAIKFTDIGGIHVHARPDAHDRRAVISIRDSGVGVAPDRQSLVFERFQQGDAAGGTPRAGVGLGLAICRDLVLRMHGEITLQSAGQGYGTTVTVWLPLHEAVADANAPITAHVRSEV